MYQRGEPNIDKYHYFTQVMGKNGVDAIEKAKKEYISRRHLKHHQN